MKDIILASQSPRRKMLLEWAEVPFEIIVKHTDENFPEGLSHSEAAIHIAHKKATAVRTHVRTALHEVYANKTILAADTIVVLDDTMIGKPVDRNEAMRVLRSLSGQQHKVITGVVILYNGGEIVFSDTTEVVFHNLTDEQIEFYVDKYKPFDKAGAYAIQEWIGVVGIHSIQGDFYNVMGLPVSRVLQALYTINN
jgi:septum formation protein